MHFAVCDICGAKGIVFDLECTEEGEWCKTHTADEIAKWRKRFTAEEIAKWRDWPAVNEAPKLTPVGDTDVLLSVSPLDLLGSKSGGRQNETETAKNPKEVRGFDQPEDGSEERYINRRKKVPWIDHTFWWIIHNNIAHPLIGIAPFSFAFKFHDWTSRRMHGVKE